jgi:Cof subfamily protein (haloacid dehalogenase superfamily)
MIRLLVSDIDGTLVTKDKRLTPAARQAAQHLADAGIALALTSSRPPRGVALFANELGLQTPRAGFNGGTITDASGNVLESLTLPADVARQALDHLASVHIDPWLFTTDEWVLLNPSGDYVDWEQHTVQMPYRIVESLEADIGSAGKIMAASKDVARLAQCETDLQFKLNGRASVHLSQAYYLDITHKDATKGYAVQSIARLLGIDMAHTAAIGDMPNDLPMFDAAGYSVAMGNAPPAVKSRAAYVTHSNEEDGWARAVENYIIPNATGG